MVKRAFDLTAAAAALLLLSPLLLIIAMLIRRDSEGPVLFTQERIGRGFRPFRIYKFRTMVQDAARRGGLITPAADPRITRIGQVLRRTKLDELPQLLNVLKGDMSFVGPRPEVRLYVERFREEYEEILTVRPGITDLASLKFRDEAAILAASSDPEATYIGCVLPEKLRLARQYARAASLPLDVVLIVKTLAALAGLRVSV